MASDARPRESTDIERGLDLDLGEVRRAADPAALDEDLRLGPVLAVEELREASPRRMP